MPATARNHHPPPEPDRGPEGERVRNLAPDAPWRLWGPYQSGRQWGTVREDYSADGDAWGYLPFEQAEARAYRWGEDGIGGLCDSHGFLHLAVALWNERDERLKERWFGLSNSQGNHGEDVKEYWWALDATPTHSWGQLLYRYPQAAFPYERLVTENARRGRHQREFELADTGVLAENRFFDVTITHAKASPDDLLVTITAVNRGPDPAPLHLIPQLWFRNTWAWGPDDRRPGLAQVAGPDGGVTIAAHHGFLGDYLLHAGGSPRVMFCDNETDAALLFGADRNPSPYPTNAVNFAVVRGDESRLSPSLRGTKVALDYRFGSVAPNESVSVELRLRAAGHAGPPFGEDYQRTLVARRSEADAFYAGVIPSGRSAEDAFIARRAFAGLLLGKQVYRYSVTEWLNGDPKQPPPPAERRAPQPAGRNTDWTHLELADVISMPDEWEYPWFAAWDLAFQAVTLAHIDPALAKDQLLLLCREWAQHPSGQLPAYEWSFSDVNPPVHPWAAWLVYVIDGSRDTTFLKQIVSKLLLNMGWWTNIRDPNGLNLFAGGFLGMDNISVFDRSRDVPAGHHVEQSDATSWVAFAFLAMLRMAQELAREDPGWAELPTTFLERFLSIAEAAENFGSTATSLWHERDGFYYDLLVDDADGRSQPIRVRSYVGLVPLLAVALTPAWAVNLDWYVKRRGWLEEHRQALLDRQVIVHPTAERDGALCLVPPDRYLRVLQRVLDTAEFLSPFGVRSLSAAYRHSSTVRVGDHEVPIRYAPGESESPMFGGNSNWRGPVWLPINVLLVDAMRIYSRGAQNELRVELPTGSGRRATIHDAADDLSERLISLFRPNGAGRRPSQPHDHPDDPLWNAHPTFSEYYHGDTGEGLGASHQTGWSALVAHLICTRQP